MYGGNEWIVSFLSGRFFWWIEASVKYTGLFNTPYSSKYKSILDFFHILDEILQHIEIWNEFKFWNNCTKISEDNEIKRSQNILKNCIKYFQKQILKNNQKIALSSLVAGQRAIFGLLL